MNPWLRTLAIGQAKITIIHIGDLQLTLAESLNADRDEWAAYDADLFSRPIPLPIYCFHIALPGFSMLVDASRYDFAPGNPYVIPGYEPPPGLLAGLDRIGVHPDEITHVVITHGHDDHFNGLTQLSDGHRQPCFANARHFLGQADWTELQAEMMDPASPASLHLGELHRRGMLEWVEGDRDLGPGLRIMPAPGETPGHQMLRLQTAGQALYFVGDLFHHIVEVEHPQWVAVWNDAPATIRSRQVLMKAALAENALLFATHIPAPGRLVATDSCITWAAIHAEQLT